MSVVVVATIRPLPGRSEEVKAAFTEVIGQVHGEDGCELYALHEGEDRLVMVEKWASREALATHSKGASLAGLGPKLAGKLVAPAEVLVFDAVPAGEPAKGAL